MATFTLHEELRIDRSLWTVPSAERAFDGWLEGKPTEEQSRLAISRVVAERAVWKPSLEGLELVERLKALIGWRIQIQFWDSIMYFLEDEGPFPLEGDCADILITKSGEFLQAYIVLNNVQEVPNSDGYTPLGYLRATEDGALQLAPLWGIYSIWPLKKMTVNFQSGDKSPVSKC